VKVEAKILIGLGAFFGSMFAVYWYFSNEDAGGVMMFGGMLLGFLPGGYYYWWSRRMKPRPETTPTPRKPRCRRRRVFSRYVHLPFTLGAGCFFMVLALVFGIWLVIPAIALVFWALVGAPPKAVAAAKSKSPFCSRPRGPCSDLAIGRKNHSRVFTCGGDVEESSWFVASFAREEYVYKAPHGHCLVWKRL